MRKIYFATAILILCSILSACSMNTVTPQSDSRIENPFTSTKPNNPFISSLPENDNKPDSDINDATWQTVEKSLGSYTITRNNENKTIVYDGNVISIPIEIKAQAENLYDITVGLSIYVDGLLQEITIDGETTSTFITDSLKAGEKISFEVKLNPVVTAEASEKSSLPIHFVTYLNPDYVPSEKSPSFGNAHHAFSSPNWKLVLNKKPDRITTAVFSDKVEKTLISKEEAESSRVHFIGTAGDKNGVYLINNGKLDYTLNARWKYTEDLKYRISFYKNNKLITFDGGKSYFEYMNNPAYTYSFRPDFDEEIKRGDFIYALAIPFSYPAEKYYSAYYSAATLCVNDDFTYEEPETSATSQKEENTDTPDNAEPMNTYYEDFCDNVIIDGKRMQILSSVSGVSIVDVDGNTVYAYLPSYKTEFTLPYDAVQIYVEPDDNGYMEWDEIDISRINEKSDDYYLIKGSTIGSDISVSGEYIAIKHDFELKTETEDEHNGEGYLIYDKKLKLVAMNLDKYCYFTDNNKWIVTETTIDSDDNVQQILRIVDDNRQKKPLCRLPQNFYISNIEKTEVGYVMVRAQSDEYERGAVAIDDQGNIIAQENHLLIRDTGQINVGAVTVFHNKTQKSVERYESGLCGADVLIFDSEDNEFRKIKVNHLAEGRGVNLSKDGKELLTWHANNNEGVVIFRWYDIKTGEMTGESISKSGIKEVYNAAVDDNYAIIMGNVKNERIRYR
ncbi:MAG: hypothetical protein IJZ51_10100 [Ruminiclostridium sp.]|nr:hypothetical protein [Ruminiclostridium sp.]